MKKSCIFWVNWATVVSEWFGKAVGQLALETKYEIFLIYFKLYLVEMIVATFVEVPAICK